MIQGNAGDGVILYGAEGTGNTIATNFILDNGGDGVLVLSASNQIGQASGAGLGRRGQPDLGQPGQRRPHPRPVGAGEHVANNEIGTQVGLAGQPIPILGTQARANAVDGVLIEDAPANTVGGLVADSGNVIAGNALDGVTIENFDNGTIPAIVPRRPRTLTSGTGNVVEGNLIGFNDRNCRGAASPTRTAWTSRRRATWSAASGGRARTSSSTTAATASRSPASRSTPPTTQPERRHPVPPAGREHRRGQLHRHGRGERRLRQHLDGILLYEAGGNTWAGPPPASNVVSNNDDGDRDRRLASTGNLVAGNTGRHDGRRHGDAGQRERWHRDRRAPDNMIGGTTAGAANVIAGNTNGVYLSGSGATGNLVEGNFIGTNTAAPTSSAIPSTASRDRRRRLEQHDRRHGRRHGQRDRVQRRRGRATSSRASATASCPTRSPRTPARASCWSVRQPCPGRPDDHFGHAPDHVRRWSRARSTRPPSTTFLIQVFSNTVGRRRRQLRGSDPGRLDHAHDRCQPDRPISA